MIRPFVGEAISSIIILLINQVLCRVSYNNPSETHSPAVETCEVPGKEPYQCQVGHCCGAEGCCTFYYELWWFWLIWAVLILLGFCCFYRRQQKRRERRTRRRPSRSETRGTYAGVCNYPGPPLDNSVLGYCKLPVYNDVIRMPPSASPPPPYSSRKPITTIACLEPNAEGETSMRIIPCNITSSMLSLASLSHYIPSLLAQSSVSNVPPVLDNRQNEIVITSGGDSNNNIVVNTIHDKEEEEEDEVADELPEKEVPSSLIEPDIPADMDDEDCDVIESNPVPLSNEGCSYETEGTSSLEARIIHDTDYSSTDDSDDDVAFGVDGNNNHPSKSFKLLGNSHRDNFYKSEVFFNKVDKHLLPPSHQQSHSDIDVERGDIVLHLSPRDSE